jgi:hypothetical protein
VAKKNLTLTKSTLKPAAKPHAKSSASTAAGRRVQVRRSGVHGKGVFALLDIAEGETLYEYVVRSSVGMRRKTATRTTPLIPTTPSTSM